MRRMLALLSVGALSALVIGAAATLAVDGGAIQAGEDLTLTCDEDGVAVAGWGLETDDGSVSFVRIGKIADDCIGNDLFVSLTDVNNDLLPGSQGSTTIAAGDADDNETKVTFNSPQDAASIHDLHVFIEGPSSTPDN